MKVFKLAYSVFAVQIILVALCFAQTDEERSRLTEVWEPVPEIVIPGNLSSTPSDAITLLSDNGFSEWDHDDGSSPKWKFCEGILTVEKKTGQIKTKRKFGDCQLHVEWRTPIVIDGDGQGHLSTCPDRVIDWIKNIDKIR